jgi:hypothetical protein
MPKFSKHLLPSHFGKMKLENEIPLKIDLQNTRELKNEVLSLERSTINQLKNLSLVTPRKKTIESIILYAVQNDSFSKN